MIDSETLKKLESIDERSWKVIYKELVRYASFKLNKAGFEIRSEKDSVDAEHFAALAIERVLDGTRAWDFNRFPDITIHLVGVVKSIISSHFKESKRSIIKAGGKEDKAVAVADNDDPPIDKLLDDDSLTTEGPEEILIREEDWKAIEDAFKDQNREDEYALYSEWLDGTPPRKIAEVLDIPVNVVSNAIKRGTRIVKNLFKKQS